ncbi:DUF4041 domain-containing protein [Kaistella sp. PBT33-4]|uniref:DUF4041 domain-containing protein n=1 Tax=Kaistella sp. PBT33-4 TaxID=3032000 RepID=UPI0023D7F1C1|nr:DUF4041 domain-containing protein [Kaistella sp. PBT33-4]MDF0720129.1 DUF4041 domain-containing protein [Kaistella sp. PBT33-4]
MTLFLSLAIFVLILVFAIKIKQKNKEITELKNQNNGLTAANSALSETNQQINDNVLLLTSQIADLNKYQGIVDTEKKAAEILQEANQKSKSIISAAEEYKLEILNDETRIRAEGNEALAAAKSQSKSILGQAQIKLDSSLAEAAKIIQQAAEKAVEIAGSAYEAMKTADEHRQTVQAMKNVIKGYGDKYVKPTFSLLDDLAEEFTHTDAGQQLAKARERNNSLIKTNLAAKCDYVEQNRKQTAVNFVLDAFNGKVDSVLSNVKKDNYGILERKIKDAFYIVNFNGKAFKNAEITNEYLDSRLDELKWAVIVQELRWQEREEQRLIREQIREEEKARREYEKAIKEADREEQLLKKLIEKAQKEVEKASEEEKAKFLLQLGELQERLQTAEEKNQRALSMAQQTKAGNVYVISNVGSFGDDVYKIGMTRRLEPLDRIRELGDASVPFEFDVHALIYSDDAPGLERQLHRRSLKLQMNKVNPRKEFFKVGIADIKDAVTHLGITAKWTMAAEARQYRESIAITEAIKNNKALEQEWERFQEEAEIEIQEREVEAVE